MRYQAIFAGHEGAVERVYGAGRRERVAGLTQLHAKVLTKDVLAAQAEILQDVEVIFGTWGMQMFSEEALKYCGKLKAVFYAAGTVKSFAQPLLERGVLVSSAWQTNGVPVAQFTLAQILLSNKGYFRNVVDCATVEGRKMAYSGPGNFEVTVSLLGAGAIGRMVIDLLRPYGLKVLVFDPYLSQEQAEKLGVEKVTIEQAFARGDVVSNHLANVPATVGMLNGRLFRLMKDDATFINTGRGATVNEAEMCEVMEARPTMMALLDVTYPEPPVADSPLYRLGNVRMSSHIAGSLGNEVVRMADHAINGFEQWIAGKAVDGAVTLEMLETMA